MFEYENEEKNGIIKGIVDVSLYQLDFYDGDYGYAKRSQLLIKKIANTIEDLKLNDKPDEININKELENLNEMKDVSKNVFNSIDDNLIQTPKKRNTFNSLLSSLDTLDPQESSMIMSAIEMSLNESISSKSRNDSIISKNEELLKVSDNFQSDIEMNHDKFTVFIKDEDLLNKKSPDENDSSLNQLFKNEEKILNLDLMHILKKIATSILLKPYNEINLNKILISYHIENFSKLNGFEIVKYPTIKEDKVDLYDLMECIDNLGGCNVVIIIIFYFI